MPSRRCFFHPTYEHPFFGLPKSEEHRKQWLKFIFGTVPEHYNPKISLCPKHFTKDSFQNLGAYNAGFSQKLLLKDGVIPTLSGHSDFSEPPQHVQVHVQQTPAADDVQSLQDANRTTENGVVETASYKEEDLDACDNDSVASSVDTTTEEMFIDGFDPILDWPEIASPEEENDSRAAMHRNKRPRLSSTSALLDVHNGRNGEESRTLCDLSTSVSTQRWRSADEADDGPSRPVFTPARTPGLTFPSNSCSKSVKFFQLFFSKTLLEEIVTNTNNYGTKYQTAEVLWEQVDLKEFESFIALVIYMGLVKCSSLANYWRDSEDFGLCFPQDIMSYQRFLFISNALYLSEEDETNKKRKETSEYERLGQIQPLYQVIREACKTFYHPFQNLTIDERMVASQGGTGLRKYTKNESASNEHKLFALSDCTNGYTWDFLVCEERSHASQSLSYESVMALVDENVLGTGYKLFVDQFYTSPTLFQDLLQKHIRACGPVKAERSGWSRTAVSSLPRNAARGTLRWIRDKELLFVRWKDAQEIQMCSTFHRAFEGDTVKRKVRRGDRSQTIVNIPIPAAVLDYDRNMDAVDPSNCVTGHFRLLHKPQKWYQCVFYHVLDIAVENAYILQKLTAKSKGRRALTRRAFLEMLILKLIAESPDPSSYTSPAPTTRTPAASSAPSSPESSSGPPSPCPASFHKPKHITQDGTAGGRRCELCQQETTVMCMTCDVMLCFQPERDCYNEWHEK